MVSAGKGLAMRASTLNRSFLLTLGACCASGMAAQVQASPIVYDWVSGQVNVTATNGNNGNDFLAAGAFLPLTAPSQVTFDSTALTIPSFEFTDQGTTSFALHGTGLTGDTLKVTDLTATP